MYNKKYKIGFTLIELLMVISIITLVSSIFFSYIGSARAKSRDSIRLSDMKQINTATTMYYEDKGELPESIGISTGIDSSKTLVGAGYLSAEPKDPKTGSSYSFRKGTVGGKPVAVVSATYETIYTTDNNPQKVGVIVGDIDASNICNLIAEFNQQFSGGVDITFPSCDSSNTSNDQIIGVTSGHRSGRVSRDIIDDVDDISSCLIVDIDKICPDQIMTFNCYCNGTLNNINPDSLPQNECKVEYGLYWDELDLICFDYVTCLSNGREWNDNICTQIIYSDCSEGDILLSCPNVPFEELPSPCYCAGTLSKGFIPPSSVWEPSICEGLGGAYYYININQMFCVFSNVFSSDCVNSFGIPLPNNDIPIDNQTDYQCAINVINRMDGNVE